MEELSDHEDDDSNDSEDPVDDDELDADFDLSMRPLPSSVGSAPAISGAVAGDGMLGAPPVRNSASMTPGMTGGGKQPLVATPSSRAAVAKGRTLAVEMSSNDLASFVRKDDAAAPTDDEAMLEGTCRGRKGRFPARCVQTDFGVTGVPTLADWQLLYSQVGSRIVMKRDALVVQQDDDNATDVLFVLRRGECELRRQDDSSSSKLILVASFYAIADNVSLLCRTAARVLARVAMGDVFNDTSFLLGIRAVSSAYVTSDEATFCQLRVADLQKCFAKNPRLG